MTLRTFFFFVAAVLTFALPLGMVLQPAGAQGKDQGLRAAAERAKKTLLAKYGEKERQRIERGVTTVASFWQPSDGDAAAFEQFVVRQFVPSGSDLRQLLQRFEETFEQVDGHFVEMVRELRRRSDLDLGPLMEIDKMFAGLNPGAHLSEDLFASKIAFVVLLNFPLTTLEERLQAGSSWTREEWAAARLAGRFYARIPGHVQARIAEAEAAAEIYIAEYNIYMHHVVERFGLPSSERPFPKGLRLISHWNLRDELKSRYATADGLSRQRLIAKVMERIVEQSIPKVVINNPAVDWNPLTNEVRPAPPETIEATEGAKATVALAEKLAEKKDLGAREPDTRYERLLECFRAARAADPYAPLAPTHIKRKFEVERELPEARVEELLTAVLTSPLIPRLAKVIEKRLGRPLEPFDIWYDGFRPRSKFAESELDARVRKRYPSAQAFEKDLPNILKKLGFSAEKARFLAERIAVDPARGAGHAMGAARRQDKAHLRTRVGKEGMNYKGFNIAIHELGHNVEQVFSLYGVDHTLLQGVPNTAFTEAIAFVFQARDLEVLGLQKPDKVSEQLHVLNALWMTYEIAGVALVDMALWRWMYSHPDAKPAELREAALRIARDVWNRYYAPVFGKKDVALLAVYSHIISSFLYVPDYPLGHLIAFQVEQHLAKKGKKAFGAEVERITRYGAVTPDEWMRHATGERVSASPLLARAAEALAWAEKEWGAAGKGGH